MSVFDANRFFPYKNIMIVRLDLYLLWNHNRKKIIFQPPPVCEQFKSLSNSAERFQRDLVRGLNLTKPLDTQLI